MLRHKGAEPFGSVGVALESERGVLMSNASGYLSLALVLVLLSPGSAVARDPETAKPAPKAHHAHHHYLARLSLPGPVLSIWVTRGPNCGAWFTRYPAYAQASCRDYQGVLTAYDPRDPTGVGVYGFRAYHARR